MMYKKRLRTKFSQEQIDILEVVFQQHNYPTVTVIDDLVERLNIPTQKITVWFQNRRARLKKNQHKSCETNVLEKDIQRSFGHRNHTIEDENVSNNLWTSNPQNNTLLNSTSTTFIDPIYHYNSPNPNHSYNNSTWTNYSYPLLAKSDIPNNTFNMSLPFTFQDEKNYQYLREFDGEP